ncbi:HET-domain-containing protein [Karstenula rhodostoma CBS 690.94]|uniref:HET-domain-containing protein n=1 Tax=Karstenula rhodostoma CBS 690.94 TaxID=1392251 RepID=A0A9P4UA27_9PLEO|nr:HET-domain-containing protein [Karstenula rhodostoma CBS 690.94]
MEMTRGSIEPHPHPESTSAILCSTCRNALESGLEDVLEESFYHKCAHHETITAFKGAVAQDCFICTKLWFSIRKEVLAKWNNETDWMPFKCLLQRRPWAAERYGAVYWHIVYMEFDFPQLDLWDLNYRGNVFCLFKNADEKRSSAEESYESSTASASVHELACTWYNVCRKSHKTCNKLGPGKEYTPTRLIDIGSEGDDTWKLCLHPDDIQGFPDYLTLSYRWAKDPAVLLLSSTIDAFRQGAPIANLPKTFRDAMTIARNFSIRYLWIDSLCIIQNSAEDWARESVLMHDVYANSACNIAASASESPEGGLFRNRKAEEVGLGYINVDLPNLGTKSFEIWDQFYIDRLTYGPLTHRGWVFQERVLAPRVLHFSPTQIVWECFEMNKCESFPNWSPHPTEVDYSRGLKTLYEFFNSESKSYHWPPKKRDEEKTMSVGVYDQWTHLVKTYSRCAFTHPEDRLIAMAGIANMFKRHTGDEYLAGLWRSRLVEGLNWIVVNPLARPRERLCAPSWSWAAVDSAVLPQKVNLPRDNDLIEIISAMVEDPVTPAGWRQVRGSIKLQGCMTEATILEGCTQMRLKDDASATPIKLLGFPSRFFVLPDTTDVTFTAGERLHLIPLRSTLRRATGDNEKEASNPYNTMTVIVEGMVLEHVTGEGDIYRRTARFVVDDLNHVNFLGLRAFPPWEGATAYNVVMDEARASVITLV